MASVLEIVNGISQVLANSYDGATDEDGEPVKIGLKREEGHPINDSRVMDGFSVKMYPGKICIHYHAEIKLKDLHKNDFESDVEGMIEQIAKFLKKEFKKITGQSLSLSADGDVKIIAQETSRVRHFIQAFRNYKCSGLDGLDKINEPSNDSIDDKFRSFMEQGGWKKSDDSKGASVYAGNGKVHARRNINSPYKPE
jgi:hypothetical protein